MPNLSLLKIFANPPYATLTIIIYSFVVTSVVAFIFIYHIGVFFGNIDVDKKFRTEKEHLLL